MAYGDAYNRPCKGHPRVKRGEPDFRADTGDMARDGYRVLDRHDPDGFDPDRIGIAERREREKLRLRGFASVSFHDDY